MEEEISSSTWISDTNWNVSDGVLENSISFETPFSAIEEESITPKHHLLLIKPSDSGPCEITISFKRKHEIRQVYVRSTARVYEIYYAADQQSSNEYLCTVRCCPAAEGDTSLHERDPEEAIVPTQEGATQTMEHLADKTTNDGSNVTGEDGWVEVKVPNSMADKNRSTERNIEDFYEATAEISDADPCISLTIRLLSLQTQGCAHVAEVYIFAEPVDTADSENQVGPMENSAGKSLMAMLVPTLLNLPKTGKSRAQERHVSDIRERLDYHNDKSNGTKLLNSTTGMTKPQEEKANVLDGATELEEVTKGSTDSTQSSEHVSSVGQRHEFVNRQTDLPNGRIEKVLDHLVCRVVRLEAFCLRFEENMLKPISSIETKLQQLEKQLELLTMRSQFSSQANSLYNDGNDPNCHRCKNSRHTQFTAPEFVCTDSESNSFHIEGIEDQKDIYVAESSTPIDDAHHPAIPWACPGLVVTAPEFSNDGNDECDNNCEDDDEQKEDSELAQKGSPGDEPSLSIDYALASALAGFLSMASVQSPGLIKTSEIITLGTPTEDNGDNHKLKSPSAIRFEQVPETGSSCVESNRKENVNDTDLASCCSSHGNEPQVTELLNESLTAPHLGQGELPELKGSCENTGMNQTGSQTSSSILISNGIVIDEQWFTTPADKSGTGIEKTTQLEEQHFVEQNNNKITDNNSGACQDPNPETVLGRTYSSKVDFELPILDVKFVSQENWNTGSSLEFLLHNMPETKIRDFCVKDEDNCVASLEFHHADNPDEQLLVGVDNLTVESESLQGSLTSANHDQFLSLI